MHRTERRISSLPANTAIIAMLTMACAGPVLALQSGDPGFGKEWVRQHPFSIQANSIYPATWNFAEYFGAGMTLLNKDVGYDHTINPIARPPQYANAPWQAILPVPVNDAQAGIIEFNELRYTPNNVGWIVGDEPTRLRMPEHGAVAAYIRQEDPSQLVFSTITNNNGSDGIWYGDGSHPNYTYSDYADDFLSIIQPDIFLYDYYPFRSNGTTDAKYLENLMIIRAKAQAKGIPYWAWIQSFGLSTSRRPSESDDRYNVYTHLTAGYTGLFYYTYDYYANSGDGLIDINGNPTPLYYNAAQVNAEAFRLGKSLRFLESTDVRFVPGRHVVFGSITTQNTTPAGLTNWSSGAGGDPHITSANVNWSQAGGIGLEKNGLLGLFVDDDGEHYFMLANLNHGQNLSAASTSLGFNITFTNDVNYIYRLNRTTGAPERISLNNHVLSLTLTGGSGDLFKYDNGFFPEIDPGDADLDGDVDLSDLSTLAGAYGQTTGGTWLTGDFDLDGDIDLSDLSLLASSYGGGTAQAFTDFQTIQAIPEPACPALLGFTCAFAFCRPYSSLRTHVRRYLS